MEVLGAVASSIAVIQALAAGKHVVSLIREMPDIQKEFEYLMKEVCALTSIKSQTNTLSLAGPGSIHGASCQKNVSYRFRARLDRQRM
jgi:hypothetical protein